MMALQGEIEDAACQQGSLNWVGRLAAVEQLLDIGHEAVEVLRAGRRRQMKQTRRRLGFALQLGGKDEILNMTVEQQHCAAQTVAVLDQEGGRRRSWHRADVHAADVLANVAWIHALAAAEGGFK